ncbi:hypothetical protein [Streptomyces sp. NPDC006997]|uniref:hypothetical protein n=1 Tax=Streptomyces sp. NPDC006997 TaxID=3155356 RepID=UPI0033C33403
MARGGVIRAGAALSLTLLAAGCADPATQGAPAAPATGAAHSPTPTPPEDLCARLVTHWSREVLDTGTYGDYQSMGLSNGQYDILREVVDAARAERDRHGDAAADALIERGARAGCVDWYRTGGPSGGPWQ